MEAARAVGIDVPEVALSPPEHIDRLPDIAGYRQGGPFYATKRFGRPDGGGHVLLGNGDADVKNWSMI